MKTRTNAKKKTNRKNWIENLIEKTAEILDTCQWFPSSGHTEGYTSEN